MVPLRVVTAAFAAGGLAASLVAGGPFPPAGPEVPVEPDAEFCAFEGDAWGEARAGFEAEAWFEAEGAVRGGATRDGAELPCRCLMEPEADVRAARLLARAEVVIEVLVLRVDTLGGPVPDPYRTRTAEDPRSEHPVLSRLQVERVWKGEVGDTATYFSHDAGGPLISCDVVMADGGRYLLFAQVDEERGWLRAEWCSGTGRLEWAEESGLRAAVAAQARPMP